MVYIVDWTTQQKRNEMANMIAAVLACPEKKCHLWYHVFSPEDMSSKQITGFMVSSCTFCMYVPDNSNVLNCILYIFTGIH